jgi:hypothetical protein
MSRSRGSSRRIAVSVSAAVSRLKARSRFALEAPEAIGVAGEHLRQDLDGDRAPEPRVQGAIDFAHSAGAEGSGDLVLAESCA